MSIGRHIKIKGAKMVGLVSCLPNREISNSYFAEKFGESSVKDVVKMIGVEKRRWVGEHSTTRDLCSAAATKLLDGLGWSPDSVDALLFFSQTPDYRLPATACALHGELGLSPSCIAFDVNLGCSGYPYALWLGSTLIQQGAARRVLLAVGDTISKLIDQDDRSTALLFGDAGTVTALEEDSSGVASFVLGTDGSGAEKLIVPSGAFRHVDCGLLGKRFAGQKSEFLYMDGTEIFNFTLKVVPELIRSTIEFSGCQVDDYDAFLFHQANQFMLNHLIKKSKLPGEKVPTNITDYGNTSCASIPLLISTRLSEDITSGPMFLGMFGFGVGFSWASAALSVGPLKLCETIEL